MLKRNHSEGGSSHTKPSKTFAKGVAIASLVAGLSACSPKAEQISTPVMPEELKDCKTFMVDPGGTQRTLYITRCPNSTTSTNYTVQSGKTTVGRTTVVIDGDEYVKVEKK